MLRHVLVIASLIAIAVFGCQLMADAQPPGPPSTCEEVGAQYAQIVYNQTARIRDLEKALQAKEVELAKLKPKEEKKTDKKEEKK